MKATEHRGITLRQLKDLEAFIDRHADKNGLLPGWIDYEGKPCYKDSINLYDVVKYVVKPATAAQKCSYVELVAPAGTTSRRVLALAVSIQESGCRNHATFWLLTVWR